MFGVDSGVETHSAVNVLLIRLEAGATIQIPTIPGGTFIFGPSGAGIIDGHTLVPEKTLAVIESGFGEIALRNIGANSANYIFANGSRIDEPWVKLLTSNGFFLCRDEEEAKRQDSILKSVGVEKYGQSE